MIKKEYNRRYFRDSKVVNQFKNELQKTSLNVDKGTVDTKRKEELKPTKKKKSKKAKSKGGVESKINIENNELAEIEEQSSESFVDTTQNIFLEAETTENSGTTQNASQNPGSTENASKNSGTTQIISQHSDIAQNISQNTSQDISEPITENSDISELNIKASVTESVIAPKTNNPVKAP